MNALTHHVVFCDRLLSLGMFSRFLQTVACVTILFLFMIIQYVTIIGTDQILFIYSSIHGHLDGFHFCDY